MLNGFTRTITIDVRQSLNILRQMCMFTEITCYHSHSLPIDSFSFFSLCRFFCVPVTFVQFVLSNVVPNSVEIVERNGKYEPSYAIFLFHFSIHLPHVLITFIIIHSIYIERKLIIRFH